MAVHWARYTRPYGSTEKLYFYLEKAGSPLTGHTFAGGDAVVSKDAGSFSSTDDKPHEVGNGWHYITPVAAETQCKVALFEIQDSVTSAWDPVGIIVETHGAGTTLFGFDLSASAPDVNLFSVNDSQANAIRLGELIGVSKKGTIKSATSPTATSFISANFEEEGDDLMNTRMGVFVTGTYAGMPFAVIDQQTNTPTSGDETFTVAPMPNVPSAGDEFVIL